MGWYKVHEGVISDSKWPLISRLSKQPKVVVVAVWMALLDHASQADERGSVARFNPREIDALLDLDDGVTQSVLSALEEEKLIENQRIVSWEKRQGASASGRRSSGAAMTSTERVRAYRARKKQAESMLLLQVAEAPDETRYNVSETHETFRNVSETHETPDKIRQDKIRNIVLPPLSPHGGEERAGSDGRTVTEPVTNVTKPVTADMPDITFEQFAEAYPPDRMDRDAAWIAWKQQRKLGQLPGLCALFSSLEAWKASEQWMTDGGRYVPLASNFLGKGKFKQAPPAGRPQGYSATRGKLCGSALTEKNMATARQVLAELKAEREMMNHG